MNMKGLDVAYFLLRLSDKIRVQKACTSPGESKLSFHAIFVVALTGNPAAYHPHKI